MVPVLSLHITVVEPKTSIEGRFLIIALFFVTLETPIARSTVEKVTKPSGTAATASEIPIRKASE